MDENNNPIRDGLLIELGSPYANDGVNYNEFMWGGIRQKVYRGAIRFHAIPEGLKVVRVMKGNRYSKPFHAEVGMTLTVYKNTNYISPDFYNK